LARSSPDRRGVDGPAIHDGGREARDEAQIC
jgi:hypothetical protein